MMLFFGNLFRRKFAWEIYKQEIVENFKIGQGKFCYTNYRKELKKHG